MQKLISLIITELVSYLLINSQLQRVNFARAALGGIAWGTETPPSPSKIVTIYQL